ncbi:MFS transporter [Pseudonocardia endophytica]|uniref:Putative MFS family arabinose efflux permease n=1 Tax=Pseudonocardia endophytica TaxID=401976 RepID=A0A4R1I6K5_PSEEN|nr:MFS transporter [Pseudonocardia endophytica]TCK25722.1 putative MFS family arabinose efflux permease [Pseudonocardia endophytica]
MPKPLVPLLVAVLVLFSAQQLLTPVLAPLSRELALTETQLGLVITVAALMLTVASPLWGRALDRFGLRTVLVTGLVLATAGLAGFAVASAAGLAQATTPTVTFTLILATRSLLFGIGIAAVPVAALAAASATTSTEADRTKVVGLVGAAQGLSLVLGPAVGGLLAVVSLMLPLYLAPVLTALLVVWVLATVARMPARTERPARAGVRPWDPRVLPLLVVGFLLYLSLGLVQVVVGFLIADRIGLDPQATAGATGVALFAAGIVLVGVQGALVPKLGWPALRLMRVGIPVAVASFVLLLFAGALWSVTVSFALLALGLGLAIPGFTAGASLAVGPEQHGAIAGLVTATTGATFMVGPLLGTVLYELVPSAPVVASLIAALIAWGFVWTPLSRRPRGYASAGR